MKKIISLLSAIVLLFCVSVPVMAEEEKTPVNNDGDSKIVSTRKSIDKSILNQALSTQKSIPDNKLGVKSIRRTIKESDDEQQTQNDKAMYTLYSENFDASTVDGISMAYYEVDYSNGTPYPAWYYSPSSYMSNPSAYPHSGTRVARFNSYSTPSGNCAALETENQIYAMYSSDINISFYMYNDRNYSSKSDCVVPYIVSPGENPIFADPVYRYDSSLTSGWFKVELTLTGGITPGEGFYLGFLGVSDYGNDIYIDTIKVSQNSYIPVSSVTLNKTSLSLSLGASEQLYATVNPSNATNKAITWSTSNASVATVSSSGVVTITGGGSTTITVRSQADSGKYATCTVYGNVSVPVSSVSLNKSSTTIVQGLTETLIATVNPSNATNKAVTWSTSNPSVASVSSSGVVTAIGAGNATITVRSQSDSTKYATCTVTVTPASTVMLGDINGDGRITSADATEALMHYAGLKTLAGNAFTAGDVNKDGRITSVDATQISMKYAGISVGW